MEKILVTGASGQLGRSVVEHLLKITGAENVSILVRDLSKVSDLTAKGVTVLLGDYNAIDTLITAFQGMDKLYFVSGSDITNRVIQHAKVVDAAKQGGVGHIYYTSFQRKPETSNSPIAFIDFSHKATEIMIQNSAITYTILKHAFYTDMLPIFFGADIIGRGMICLPAGNGKVSFATRDDMAEAGAMILTHQGTAFDNMELDLAGDESFSIADIAEILSELSNKTITYQNMTAAEFHELAKHANLPTMIAQIVCSFSQAIAGNELDLPDPTLKDLLGRKIVNVRQFLSETYRHVQVPRAADL